MSSQFAVETYTKSHMLKVRALDTLIVIIGLILAASPFAEHAFPGAMDTTIHVALGMLIATCAAFRAAIAFGSLWVEVVLFAFGLLVLLLPKLEHMQWHDKYNTAHLVCGGLVMALSAISALITVPVLKKAAQLQANMDIAASLEFLGMTLAELAAARGKHPQSLREEYRARMRKGEGLTMPAVTRRVDDPVDGTVKFCLPVENAGAPAVATTLPGSASLPLLAPPPQLETESVIIPMTSYRGSSWHTLCISSQVGCRMGCTFCETGRMGLIRNLTAGEIVRQRLVARQIRLENPPPIARGTHQAYFVDGIQNIVFMGMGEPLDNFDNLVQAIRVLSEPQGMNFPHQQICVSTVGRIDGLRKLGELKWINLRIAVSLNAANDKLRDELMPINKGMPLADLKRALQEYPMSPRGLYLIEYVLIKGVNDSPADAAAVAAFCQGLRCIVNVIPYNPQRYAAFETPSDETILAFMVALKSHGIFVKRRITHGRSLMGACGQLGNPEIRRRPANKGTTAQPQTGIAIG